MRARIIVGVATLVIAFGSQPMVAQAPATTECRDWADSGTADARFKVWACRGGDPATTEAAIRDVSALMDEVWGPMTQPVPVGMGAPLPDATGSNVPLEYGRDGRIDVYVLAPGEAVFRGGRLRSIDSASAAAAGVSLLPEGARGASPNGASGYMLVDRSRIGDDVAIRQDIVHEFFHVLQYAHNAYAPVKDPSHWFVEASAVWAETYYLRDHSVGPHEWFRTFQASRSGLEDPDVDHRYAAYIWPFFMEQERGRDAIMQAWAEIGALTPASDYTAVSDVIDRQLPFAKHFRAFAVRNLNNHVLDGLQPPERTYGDLDGNFPTWVPPGHIESQMIVSWAPTTVSQSIPPLAAGYVDLHIPPDIREVTITLGLGPAGSFDSDALVHLTEGWWERRPIEGGELRFCRDENEPFDDIDEVMLVLSNHDRQATVSGSVEASGKDRCDQQPLVLEGTIDATTTMPVRMPGDVGYTVTWHVDARLVGPLGPGYTLGHESGRVEASAEYTGDCEGSDTWRADFTEDEIAVTTPIAQEDGTPVGSIEIWDGPVGLAGGPQAHGERLDVNLHHDAAVAVTCGLTGGHPTPEQRTPWLASCPDPNDTAFGASLVLRRDPDGVYRGSCSWDEDAFGTQGSWKGEFRVVSPSPSPAP